MVTAPELTRHDIAGTTLPITDLEPTAFALTAITT
jgi:hypothetical protein